MTVDKRAICAVARKPASFACAASPVAGNFLFPYPDAAFTLVFIRGLVHAATGNFMIVGPMTLLVMPLNAAISAVMYLHQRKVFASLNPSS
jgi:hypothetical protein